MSSVHRYLGTSYLSAPSEEPLHQCDECVRRFFSRHKLSRHLRNVHGDRVFCSYCYYSVPRTRKYQLKRHEKTVHQSNSKCKPTIENKKPAAIEHLPETTVRPTVGPPSPMYSDISSVTSLHQEDPLDLSEWDFLGLSFPELMSFQDPKTSVPEKLTCNSLATPDRVSTPDCAPVESSSPIPVKVHVPAVTAQELRALGTCSSGPE
ncbi:zinc finger protein PLAGL2-like [Saccostrea echinata]|uniref:zinc finger protein PLAGL2-like n=1 Tax=Saccostrea echinata TaxID=191078 RepID=UPI002A7ED3B3|nr:zinc finger protein PLAGL2-like [Saccostrea echinata]